MLTILIWLTAFAYVYYELARTNMDVPSNAERYTDLPSASASL
jgi:hypothetical protein